MSAKRSRVEGTPSAPKRHETPATGSAATAPTATRGRVLLDVGGTRFCSSRSTLESTSEYFRSMLMRWEDGPICPDDPIFVDADADAFQVCLSYMRSSTVVLPSDDHALCSRVILLADFLGLDDFIDRVKRRAHANMHPDADASDASAAAFDAEVGSLQQACESGVLPARYFSALPPPPEVPPERVIKALYPVSGYRAFFADHELGASVADNAHSQPVVSLALVQLRNGNEVTDALISVNDFGFHNRRVEDRNADTRSQLVYASEYARHFPWEHWFLVAPSPEHRMIPIPPGSIRGRWQKPAFSPADAGKAISISDGKVTVNGESREVVWDEFGQAADCSGTIRAVDPEIGGRVYLAGEAAGSEIGTFVNAADARGEVTKADLAFASIGETRPDGYLKAKFYMPLLESDENYGLQVSLAPAESIQFNGDNTLAGFETCESSSSP